MSVSVKRVDTIAAQVPIPANSEDTQSFLRMLQSAADEGYVMRSAGAITEGQRDPVVVGLTVVMGREPTA